MLPAVNFSDNLKKAWNGVMAVGCKGFLEYRIKKWHFMNTHVIVTSMGAASFDLSDFEERPHQLIKEASKLYIPIKLNSLAKVKLAAFAYNLYLIHAYDSSEIEEELESLRKLEGKLCQ
jgi:hypothetical protein